MRGFLKTEAAGATVMLAATLAALAWANSPWTEAYHDVWATEVGLWIGKAQVSMTLEHWVNDALLAVFFFVVGLEVRRELSVGELTDRRRTLLPVGAGIGGVLLPVAVYLLVAPGPALHAWGVVIGTDTAFLLGALALVGPRVATQLRLFLLTVTVIDDIVAVAVIGAVYSQVLEPSMLLPP